VHARVYVHVGAALSRVPVSEAEQEGLVRVCLPYPVVVRQSSQGVGCPLSRRGVGNVAERNQFELSLGV